MNRRRKAAPGIDVQQNPCIQKQCTSSGHGHNLRSSISSNSYKSDNDHDSVIDCHGRNGNEQHGYHPRSCIKPPDKCRYSSAATTTTKQQFSLTVMRNAIGRTILQQQQKNLQPLVLMLFIPICLWINTVAVSSSSSSSSSSWYSFFHNYQFQWTKHYPDAPFRPRMLQLLHPLEDTNLKYVTRLSLKEDVVFPSLQQQQKRVLQKSTRRPLASHWDNHGPIRALNEPDDMRTRDTCIYLADWQLAYHPSCNDIHTVDLASTSSSSALINKGAYRDVWKIPDTYIRAGQGGSNDTAGQQQYRVLKTLRYRNERIFDLRNFDRHRRDAMAFQELQSSKHVMDIYGHCANSALFDYSAGGDLWGLFGTRSKRHRRNDSLEDDNNNTSTINSNSRQQIDNSDATNNSTPSSLFVLMQDDNDEDDEPKQEQPTKFQLLQIAHSIASAVADAHHVDSLGRPTMAHADIKPDQWILVSSSSTGGGIDDSKNETTTTETTKTPSFRYQLGDFNRARFLTWDTVQNETCPFHVDKNGGRWRSPEEYNHENQTEKGDVWSLGNMLYFLISGGNTPFGDLDDDDEAIELVKIGGHPTIDEYYNELRMRGTTTSSSSSNATNDNDDSLLFLDIMGNAMMSCFEFDPKKRPTAHQIVAILEQGLVTWTSSKKKKK